MTKELTRKMLEEMGITEVRYDKNAEHQWVVTRNWYYKKTKDKKITYPRITEARGKNKYTCPKIYLKVQFNYKGKSYAIPLGRFIYAWFKGDVPAGYDVDHINNCPWDNNLDNLQLLTREENIRKRYVDNPEGCWNQWQAMKKYHKEM